MLIELFTNGSVLIDGEVKTESYKPEEVLYDYLKDSHRLIARFQRNGQKTA